MDKDSFIKQVLLLAVEFDIYDEIFWDSELDFFVKCSDVFYWGTADLEEITPESIDVLRKALTDTKYDGCILYCARQRKMRPQGAMYEYLESESWHLFNECGPKREVELGNPRDVPEVKQ